MKRLDCLKGGIDFSRYFPQIANESVSSQSHLQLERERTTGLIECLLPVLGARTYPESTHKHMEVFVSGRMNRCNAAQCLVVGDTLER